MSSMIESPRIAKVDEDEDEKKEGGSASSKQLRGAILPSPPDPMPCSRVSRPHKTRSRSFVMTMMRRRSTVLTEKALRHDEVGVVVVSIKDFLLLRHALEIRVTRFAPTLTICTRLGLF